MNGQHFNSYEISGDGPVSVSRKSVLGGSQFSGVLHEFRISRSIRYSVTELPAESIPGLENDADTLVLYRFNDTTGNSIVDASPNSRHGVLNRSDAATQK